MQFHSAIQTNTPTNSYIGFSASYVDYKMQRLSFDLVSSVFTETRNQHEAVVRIDLSSYKQRILGSGSVAF